jgi:hypothetical protein
MNLPPGFATVRAAKTVGYPASSWKERVYALSSTRGGGDIDRCGILIYTASAGAQGTLGGLVATGLRESFIAL